MTGYISLVLTWILFLALFPLAYFWLRRAWRIAVRKDYSEVAVKRGVAVPDGRRWAPYELAINAIAGGVVVVVIVAVAATGMPYENWTAIAGSTIWCKYFADFALSRHAHGFGTRKKA